MGDVEIKKGAGVGDIFRVLRDKVFLGPLFLSRVSAGFPSPADDYLEQSLDLNQHLISNPSATFFVRAAGDSMEGAGIFSGDLLVVDRALEAVDGRVVVAVLDGELTLKRLIRREGKLFLFAENAAYPPIEINPEGEFTVWGVATYVIHRL